MKKWIAILLGVLLLVPTAACINISTESGESGETADLGETLEELLGEVTGMLAGGWSAAEDFTVTEDQKAVFDKAMEEPVGVNYTPIACLGTQVVAGTNYCFLTQATVVVPDATPSYKLVFIYRDLEGNASVMNIADLPIIPNDDGTTTAPTEEMLMGGWSYAESYEITDELDGLLNKALDGMTGADYTAVAELGTQVVAGLNHCMLCKVTPVVPDAVSHYALVYLYQNLEGGAELLNVIDFDFGALCTYGG